jgi:hypothetical protein
MRRRRECYENVNSDPRDALYSHDVKFRPYDEERVYVYEYPDESSDKLFDHVDDMSLGAYDLSEPKYHDPRIIQGLSQDDYSSLMINKRVKSYIIPTPLDDGKDDPEDYRGHMNNLDIYCISDNKIRDTTNYGKMVHDAIISSGDENEYYDYELARSGKVPLGMDEDEASYNETDKIMYNREYSEKDVNNLMSLQKKRDLKTIRGIPA